MSLGECGALHQRYELNLGMAAFTKGVIVRGRHSAWDAIEIGADAADSMRSGPLAVNGPQ